LLAGFRACAITALAARRRRSSTKHSLCRSRATG
jgi:hypothetical protein